MTNEADKRDYKHLSGRSESSGFVSSTAGEEMLLVRYNLVKICPRLRGNNKFYPSYIECCCCLALSVTFGEDNVLAEFH